MKTHEKLIIFLLALAILALILWACTPAEAKTIPALPRYFLPLVGAG